MGDIVAAVIWIALWALCAYFIGWSFGLWEWLGYLLS
jgi:hypothetical protein